MGQITYKVPSASGHEVYKLLQCPGVMSSHTMLAPGPDHTPLPLICAEQPSPCGCWKLGIFSGQWQQSCGWAGG